MMKKAIVNVYSEGREDYEKLSQGLFKSIENIRFDCDVFAFSPLIKQEETINFETFILKKIPGWPKCSFYGQSASHKEIQHQFKAFAIQAVREREYNQIMWCDSPIRIRKDPTKYFDLANELGIVTFDAEQGSTEAVWTSDICLASMNCNIDYARTFNQCSSGVMVFDFSNKRGCRIFEEFAFYCLDKEVMNMKGTSSRPEFIEHRSDQSVISFLIKKYDMNNLSHGTFMHKDFFFNKNIYNLSPTFINGDL